MTHFRVHAIRYAMRDHVEPAEVFHHACAGDGPRAMAYYVWLVAGSAPDTVNALRIRSAEPVTAWPTGPVTLLGDAIHNMTPMAGIGANTALRDADLLRRNLITASPDVTAAVADYERRMLDYGFTAVARSLRNTRFATSGHRVARGVLRAVNLVPPLKRRMLGS